jgi:DNA polymerase bacteriophage-type
MHATIDFETYSEAGFVYDTSTRKWGSLLNASKKGLPGVGMAVYSKHPSTEILSLAYKLPHSQDIELWTPGHFPPADLLEFIAGDGLIEAWNVGFERWIWEEVAVKKYGFSPVPVNSWRCAAAKSRAYALPGHLGDACKVLQTESQKNTEGKRLIVKFSCPRNPTIKNASLRTRPYDDHDDAVLLYRYNVDDVKAELGASGIVPDLSAFELEFWQCDQEINHRGVQLDVVSVLNCIHIIEQAHIKYNAELPALTGGAVTASSQIARIRKWLASCGVDVASLDEEHLNGLLKNPLLLPQCRRVLEIRQLIGSAAVKKLYAMLNQCTPAGRLHDLFIYHSARTGRAAGMGVQPQNLPRGQENFDVDNALGVISSGCLSTVEKEYGNATTTVSNCLRGMFIARDGHELISSDYSAIEAVVLAELAGETWRKEVFRTHGKIYEMSASKITGLTFDQILAHKEKTGKHHECRKLGKVAELASGYGGWLGAWLAFGADEFLSEYEIERAILAWRAASPEIVEFWGGQMRKRVPCLYGVEGAAIQAVLYPGQPATVRGITFKVANDVLFCTLPSGRDLVYHRPRFEPSTLRPGTFQISYEGWNTNPKNGAPGWLRQSTYGGKLVENITQAVARDILANAIINLERAGYPVVLHVHDEIVCEVPTGTKRVEEFEAIMSTMPDWAEGWPVVARGGWVGKRYRK